MASRIYFALILLATSALASDVVHDMVRLRPGTLPSSGKNGELRVEASSNKLKKYSEAAAAWQEISGSGGGGARNVAGDPGFEDGGGTWTASGGSFTIDSTTPLFDTNSGVFNASASGQTLCSDLVPIPEGWYGANGSASAYFQTAATDYLFYAFDGTNVLGSSQLVNPQIPGEQGVNFIFPSSGDIQFCVESQSNAGDIEIDDVKISTASNLLYVMREMVGWHVSGVPTAVGFGSADPMIFSSLGTGGYDTVGGYDTGTGLYESKVAGKYKITCTATITGTYAANQSAGLYLMKNGSTSFGHCNMPEAGVGTAAPICSGTIELAVGDTVQCNPETVATGPGFSATAYFNVFEGHLIQENQSVGIVPEEPWYVSAYTGGANPSLSGSTVGSLQGIEDSNLDLNAEAGSLAVEVPCSSTNPSSGSTCSAGDEQIGVAFTPTQSGNAEVCFDFSVATQFSGGSESYYASFLVVQTPNNSQTPDNTANAAAEVSWSGTQNVLLSTSRRACGIFPVVANVKQTFRLFYKQTVSGTPTAFSIRAVQNQGNEQSNVRITAHLVDQQMPMPVIVNGVSTPDPGMIRIVAALVVNTGAACSITNVIGNSFTNGVRNGTGDCNVDFSTAFPSTPTCQLTAADASSTALATLWTVSPTTLRFASSLSGVATDLGVHVMCMGPR